MNKNKYLLLASSVLHCVLAIAPSSAAIDVTINKNFSEYADTDPLNFAGDHTLTNGVASYAHKAAITTNVDGEGNIIADDVFVNQEQVGAEALKLNTLNANANVYFNKGAAFNNINITNNSTVYLSNQHFASYLGKVTTDVNNTGILETRSNSTIFVYDDIGSSDKHLKLINLRAHQSITAANAVKQVNIYAPVDVSRYLDLISNANGMVMHDPIFTSSARYDLRVHNNLTFKNTVTTYNSGHGSYDSSTTPGVIEARGTNNVFEADVITDNFTSNSGGVRTQVFTLGNGTDPMTLTTGVTGAEAYYPGHSAALQFDINANAHYIRNKPQYGVDYTDPIRGYETIRFMDNAAKATIHLRHDGGAYDAFNNIISDDGSKKGELILKLDSSIGTDSFGMYGTNLHANSIEFVRESGDSGTGDLFLHNNVAFNQFKLNTHSSTPTDIYVVSQGSIDLGSVSYTGSDNTSSVIVRNDGNPGIINRRLTGTWQPAVEFNSANPTSFTAYGNLTFEKQVTNNDTSGNAYSTINLDNSETNAHLTFSGGLNGSKEFNITKSSATNEANLTLDGAYNYNLHNIGASGSNLNNVNFSANSGRINEIHANQLKLTNEATDLSLTKHPEAIIEFAADAKLTISDNSSKALTATGGKGYLTLSTSSIDHAINAEVKQLQFTANNLQLNADILKTKEISFADKGVLSFGKDVSLNGKVIFNNNILNLGVHKVTLDEGVLSGVNSINTELSYQGQGNFKMGHFETKTGHLSFAPGEDKFIINLKTNATINEGDNFTFIKGNAVAADLDLVAVKSPGALSNFVPYVYKGDLVFTASLNQIANLIEPELLKSVGSNENLQKFDNILNNKEYRDNPLLVKLNNADYQELQVLVEQVLGEEKGMDVTDVSTAINTASSDTSLRMTPSIMSDNSSVSSGQRMEFVPGVWTEYKRSEAQQSKNRKSSHSYKSHADTITLGSDVKFENNDLLGIAATLVNSKSKYKANYNKGIAKTEAKLITLYGLKTLPRKFFATGSLSGGANHRREESTINGLVNKKVSDFIAVGARLGYGYNYKLLDLVPYLSYSFERINIHGQKQNAQSYKSVDSFNINSHKLGAGLNVALNIRHKNSLIRPFANIDYNEQLNAKPVKYNFNIAGIRESFQQTYTPTDIKRLSTNMGIELVNEKYSLEAKYSTSFANKFKEQAGALKLKVNL